MLDLFKFFCWLSVKNFWGSPCGSAGEESTCNEGNLGLIPELGRAPGERKGYPLQYSGLENFSPWFCKELDRTKLVEVMEFQLSYFKSWKMMLSKCCTLYASKFGKLSSGHRTGKGQFSFQSQRKAMPKNSQTTAQLHSSHMLVK